MLLSGLYDFIFREDIENRALVSNSYVISAVVSAYVLFVQWIGPTVMKSRKPFNLKKAIIVYNFSQMIVNACIAFQLISFGYKIWDDRCMIPRNPRYPQIIQTVKIFTWYTYLVKLADCLDTVFFVLRKKSNQITFLHVFHHGFVCILCHFYLRYIRLGYYLLLAVAMNNIIHFIMYFYYALAALGPSMQKYLWWKKYLTVLQMIQFIVLLGYMLVGFLTKCEELGVAEIIFSSFIVLILILFINFYRKSFKRKIV